MKKLLLLLSIILMVSCTHSNKISQEQMRITRTYIGSYISYEYRAPMKWTEPHICWVKTTIGEISVFAKEIEFKEGEWLYINRVNSPIPGSYASISTKQIESSNSEYYYKLNAMY